MQIMQAHFDVVVHRVKGLSRKSRGHAPVSPSILGNPGPLSTSSIGPSAVYHERVHVSVSKDVHVQSGTKVGHETRPPRQVARLLVLRNVLQPIYMWNHVHVATYPSPLSLPLPFWLLVKVSR